MNIRRSLAAVTWILLSCAAITSQGQITLTWNGSVSTNWGNASNWTPQQVPTSVDHVIINSGIVAVPAAGVFSIFDWNGGTLNGAVNVASGAVFNINGNVLLDIALTNAGTMNWSNGSVNMANNVSTAGPIINQPGATWNIACDNFFSTENVGGYPTYPNAYIVNSGLVRKTAGTGVTQIGFGASYGVQFRNAGTVEADAGTINFEGGGPITGVYTTAAAGTVEFGHGTYTTTNFTCSGAGTFEFAGDNLTFSNDIPAGFKLIGGNVLLGPSFQGGTITSLTLAGSTLLGAYTVGGVLNWNAGYLNGALTVSSGGTLNIAGNDFLDAALTNSGTVNWTSGNVNMAYNNTMAGPIVNQAGGTWNISGNDYFSTESNPGYPTETNAYFINNGLIRKTGGGGTTQLGYNGGYIVQFRNYGTAESDSGILSFEAGGLIGGSYTAGAGATINFSKGAFGTGGATFGGAGTTEFTGDTLTLSNTVPVNLKMLSGSVILGPLFQGGSITNLSLAGSVLLGNYNITGVYNCAGGTKGNLTVAGGGVMNWTAGDVAGSLIISNNAVLNLGGALFLDAAVTNYGTINWTNGDINMADTVSSAGPVVIEPGAVWNIQCDDFFSTDSAPGYPINTNAYILNFGTVRKTANTGITQIGYHGSYAVLFKNFGTVEADKGVFDFEGGYQDSGAGTLAFAPAGLAGTNYGTINFASKPILSAGLNLALLTRNGFQYSAGQSFRVLSFAPATNWLSCLGGLDLENGILFQPRLTYTNLSLLATAYSTSLAVPQLFITRSLGGVSVTWPDKFPTWTLQATTNLSSPAWQTMTACEDNAIVTNNGHAQFFRLTH